MFNRRILTITGLIIALSLFVWLLINSTTEDILTIFRFINIEIIMFLLLLQVLTVLLVSLQWKMLFKASMIQLSYKKVLMMNFIGTFFESITPAMKSGGEAFKLVYLKKNAIPVSLSAPILLVQKLTSFTIFLLLAVLSFLTMFHQLNDNLNRIVIISLSLFMIAILIGLSVLLILSRSKHKSSLMQTIKTSLNTLQNSFKTSKHKYFILIFVSITIWLLFALKLYIILRIFIFDIQFLEAAFLTYIPYSIGLLPLAPGGLGTFEATMTYLLYPGYMQYSSALTVTLVFRFITHWFVFFLAILYITYSALSKRRIFYEKLDNHS